MKNKLFYAAPLLAVGLGALETTRSDSTILGMVKDAKEIFVADDAHAVTRGLADQVYVDHVNKGLSASSELPGRDVTIIFNDAREDTNAGRNIGPERIVAHAYDTDGGGVDPREVSLVTFQQSRIPDNDSIAFEDIRTTFKADSMIIEKWQLARSHDDYNAATAARDVVRRVSITRSAGPHYPMDAARVKNLYNRRPK